MIRFAVIADDLTGALVSASGLRQRGMNVDVLWKPDQVTRDLSVDAVVVDMRSRDLKDGHRKRATEWARTLIDAGYTRLECRMDSTLNGHPREEMDGIIDAAGFSSPLILAVPASPAAGRITRDGWQLVHNESSGTRYRLDVAQSLFGRPADLLIDSRMIARGGRYIAEQILRGRASGTGLTYLLADSESDNDLAVVAHAASLLAAAGQELCTASPGAWLASYPRIDQGEFTLVVISSPTKENLAQQSQFGAQPSTCLLEPADVLSRPAESWSWILTAGTTVVMSTISDPLAVVRDGDRAGLAAQAAAAVLDQAGRRGLQCSRIVVTGGYAAQLLVDELGVSGLSPLDQVGPMCSRARIRGGRWDGLTMVTKGGQMGTPGTLVALASGGDASVPASEVTARPSEPQPQP